MAQKALSVLISGGGIAGISLALTLARSPGFKVKPRITLIERAPTRRTTGQAIDIRGPGVDMICKLGLEPQIKAQHTTETGLVFIDAKGNRIAKFDATGDAKKQSATSEYEILRGDLAKLLLDELDATKEQGSVVNVVYGESIESLDDRPDGVDVKFAHGKLDNQLFDVVIGCDGIASKTRRLIFGEEDHRDHVRPSGMYIGFFTVPRIREDVDLFRWCTLGNGMAMHLRPHRNPGTMGCYFTITNSTKANIPEIEEVLHRDVAAQKDYLHKRFQNAGYESERLVDGLDKADDFYMTHWCQVVTPQWTKGRCAILGDAAFATMGIGTSLAMVGAYTMAGELSKITSSEEVPAALQNYEKVYRPFTSKFEKAPAGFPQLANPQTGLGVSVMHTILKTVTWTGLDKLLLWFFGGEDRHGWTLPDYGWSQPEAVPGQCPT
jgi:2-polyprenyl-6-methoxyphenol hydroxylase-like FAD-dependent oxidoreductase